MLESLLALCRQSQHRNNLSVIGLTDGVIGRPACCPEAESVIAARRASVSSSKLRRSSAVPWPVITPHPPTGIAAVIHRNVIAHVVSLRVIAWVSFRSLLRPGCGRSEEHTSEL